MVRIAISQAAFDAIAATLPLGSTGYENAVNERGERYVWLDRAVVDRLRAMRGAGELQRCHSQAGEGDASMRMRAAALGSVIVVTFAGTLTSSHDPT